MHVLVDGSTDDLLTAVSCRLRELRRVEHGVDLGLVHVRLGAALYTASRDQLMLLLHLLDLLLCLVSLVKLGLMHLVRGCAVGQLLLLLLRVLASLDASLVAIWGTMLSLHALPLMASIGVAAVGPVATVVAVMVSTTWVLVTNDAV